PAARPHPPRRDIDQPGRVDDGRACPCRRGGARAGGAAPGGDRVPSAAPTPALSPADPRADRPRRGRTARRPWAGRRHRGSFATHAAASEPGTRTDPAPAAHGHAVRRGAGRAGAAHATRGDRALRHRPAPGRQRRRRHGANARIPRGRRAKQACARGQGESAHGPGSSAGLGDGLAALRHAGTAGGGRAGHGRHPAGHEGGSRRLRLRAGERSHRSGHDPPDRHGRHLGAGMEPLRLAFDAILSSAHLPVVFLGVACVLLVAGSRALLVESAVRERAADLPPPAWRHVWRLVGVVSIACRPLIAADLRLRTARRLRSAGLEFAVLPDEWVAASLLAGGAGALAGITLALVAGFPALAGALPAVVLGLLLPQAALADRIQGRRRAMARQLPFLLDLITLGVESGLNPSAAITLAVAHAPAGAMRDELARVLRDVRAGRPRAEALRLLAERTEI